jgi:hypothetical protein
MKQRQRQHSSSKPLRRQRRRLQQLLRCLCLAWCLLLWLVCLP